jgi:arylsulfatase A-like enzyme
LVDVAPTLCALAGIAPAPAFVGRNLLPPTAAAPPPRPLLFHGNFWGPPHHGWLCDGYKLIVRPDGVELFDLRADPCEETDLSTIEVARLQQMRRDLDAALQAASARSGDEAEPLRLSPDEQRRLRSLGYVP